MNQKLNFKKKVMHQTYNVIIFPITYYFVKRKGLHGIKALGTHPCNKVKVNMEAILKLVFHKRKIRECPFILHAIKNHHHA
jgi:hypothetical protein